MTMRRKTNRKVRRLKNRTQGLKSSHFTRKGTKQVYGKGPQGGKSFPHGILTSEDNYGGYNIPKNYPIGFVSLGAELFGVGIDCYLPNGQGYSLECTQQSTSGINDGCNHEVQDCEDNFGGTATLVVG